jgi:coenzyme F420-reducing hydrogenase alpha subunit
METALAEKERERMIAMHGPFPRFDVVAAFGCLLVEILQAAEIMQDLYAEDNFIGPSFRKVPEKMGLEGQAALESPQGTLYHHFRATPEGLVNAFDCLDTAAENNALRCLLSQKTVENAREQNLNWKKTKARLELSLLPF